jgi:hypothetical protein
MTDKRLPEFEADTRSLQRGNVAMPETVKAQAAMRTTFACALTKQPTLDACLGHDALKARGQVALPFVHQRWEQRSFADAASLCV